MFGKSIFKAIYISDEIHLLLLLGLVFSVSSLGLDRGQVNTLVLGERNEGILALADDEDVSDSGGEGVASGVSDVDDIETAQMSISGGEDSDSSDIVSLKGVDEVASFELDNVEDLAGFDIQLDGVMSIDIRVGISDGSAVVGNNVGDSVGAHFLSLDLAELEFGFLRLYGSQDELALDVVEDSEIFTGLLEGDDVHETSGESFVSSDLSINEDVAFLVVHDHLGFSAIQSVFKSVLDDKGERNGFSELVGTLRRSDCLVTTSLIQQPALRSGDSLQMLLGTSCHLY